MKDKHITIYITKDFYIFVADNKELARAKKNVNELNNIIKGFKITDYKIIEL